MTQESFDPPVVVKIYKIYLLFSPLLYHFPKLYRYSLGQTIEKNLLKMIEFIFEANALPKPLREPSLIRASAKCELLKILVRLSFELDLIGSTQYFQLIADLKEVNKMLCGWVAYVRSGPSKKSE
jgi:hypothetical protein